MTTSQEHPPLGKTFITGYDANDEAYPILAVAKDPRLNATPPTVGTTTGLSTEAITAWPDNKFTRVQQINEQRELWLYELLPGPVLTTKESTADFNGDIVPTTRQRGLIGALDPETGAGFLESVFAPTDAVQGVRTTKKLLALPDDYVEAFWDYVSIPRLIFDINHEIFCNLTSHGKVVSTPDEFGGVSMWRKHRRFIKYHSPKPDPDLSGAAYETAIVAYEGIYIGFNYRNVLNDAISFNGDFIDGDCTWTEDYSFAATDTSATEFQAGLWFPRSYEVQRVGSGVWKSIFTEYYSAEGNPSIT